jgi:hypothetical protein
VSFQGPQHRPPQDNPYAPPQNPAPGWGPPPGYYAPPYVAPQPSSSMPTIAIVLAALSWMSCGIVLSLPALIIAKKEIGAIERGEANPSGLGVSKAAFWIAALNVGFTVLVIVAYAIFIAVALSQGRPPPR